MKRFTVKVLFFVTGKWKFLRLSLVTGLSYRGSIKDILGAHTVYCPLLFVQFPLMIYPSSVLFFSLKFGRLDSKMNKNQSQGPVFGYEEFTC